ncbi:MAG: hypothetical protein KY455_12265 [Euryarchaeota archaeon]|nr:hypothetical protein [Euryarchaeota archaeon]
MSETATTMTTQTATQDWAAQYPKPTKTAAELDNFHTGSTGRVDSTKDLDAAAMERLLDEHLPHLPQAQTFRWDADIDGIIVRLVTNSRHQFDFWVENWKPAPPGIKPHGFLYSVNGIPDKEPHAYYSPDRDTALFVNTEYYGQCKSWALGLAAVVLERKFNTHSIHGAAALIGGKGVVLIAPTGTGKTTQVNRLMQHPQGKVVGDDWVYITVPKDIGPEERLHVYQPEQALYVRTENAEAEPWLIPIFDNCRLENVVTTKGGCESPSCDAGKCMFNLGYDYCYWGFGNSRALLPREWMKGPEKVGDVAPIDLIVMLRRDSESPAIEELDEDGLIELLKEGKTMIRPGAGPKEKWGTYKSEPWYNPYLLAPDHDRQEQFFREEARRAKCIVINTGLESETIDRSYRRILEYAGVEE